MAFHVPTFSLPFSSRSPPLRSFLRCSPSPFPVTTTPSVPSTRSTPKPAKKRTRSIYDDDTPRVRVSVTPNNNNSNSSSSSNSNSSSSSNDDVYGYEVSSVLESLAALPPRGSIARTLEPFRGKLTLHDISVIFRELSLRGDWQRSLRLYRHLSRQSKNLPRPDEHVHALLISSLSSHPHDGRSLLPRCLDLFHRDMQETLRIPPSPLSYTAIINAFARHPGHHNTALDLLHSMIHVDRVPRVLPAYNSVLLSCARAKDDLPIDVLLGLLADLRRHGLRPDLVTYNAILYACALRALPADSEAVFFQMCESGIVPNPSSLVHLVDCLQNSPTGLGRVSEILRESEESGIALDTSTYNVLVEAYAKSGDAHGAIGVLRQMQKARCTPDTVTYRILLGVYGRSGRYEDVRELFLEMKIGNTVPDVATYNVLMKVFGEGGYFKDVITLFRDMVEEEVEPNMETYDRLFFACGKGGSHKDAKEMVLYVNGKGVVLSSRAYAGVIEAYGQAALYEEALVTYYAMLEKGVMPTIETYSTLLGMYARGGLVQEVKKVLLRMDKAEILNNEDTYNSLIKAYCKAGEFKTSMKAFVDMQDLGCTPNVGTFEAVLEVFSTSGLLDVSREQFMEIISLGIKPSVVAYCLLLSVYAKNERWDEAYELLDEMKTGQISNTHQVIGSMIKGDYDDESNWQMVEYVFDNLKSEGCDSGLQFYNALLEALWWLGQKARAKKVLLEATNRGLYPELYRQSKLVWSVDVHRMSVGGALIAILSWLKDVHERFEKGQHLPHVASIVVARGEAEIRSVEVSSPVAMAAYAFLKDHVSPSFSFPAWNKGRITLQKTPLRRLLSSFPTPQVLSAEKKSISITDSVLPAPGTKLHTMEVQIADQPISEAGLQIPKAAAM